MKPLVSDFGVSYNEPSAVQGYYNVRLRSGPTIEFFFFLFSSMKTILI